MKSKILAFVCAGFAMTGVAFANGDLKAEIADLRAKVASLETAQMAPAAGGDCSTLTSMKKKGCITIGGQAQVDIVVIQREEMNAPATAVANKAALEALAPGQRLEDGDRTNTTYFGSGLPFGVSGTYLDFQINASPDTYLYIKLDLDDFVDGAAQATDLLEEVYFAWDKVRCSNFDIRVGRKTVDYGQDKYMGIVPSFQDGWAYFMTMDGVNTVSDNIGSATFPTAPFHAFQIEAIYHWKDLVNVYATLFQNATGMHEDRSNDNLFFESYAVKVEYMPMENLTLQASFMNQHDENDNGLATPTPERSRSNMRSMSLAGDYTFKCLPLNIWTEYQHSWDLNYDGDASCDVFSLGGTWSPTECIDISLLGEYAQVDGANPLLLTDWEGGNAVEDEDYAQVVLTGTYTFENGIYMTLEYAHMWYDADTGPAFQEEERDADIFGFRTGWEF